MYGKFSKCDFYKDKIQYLGDAIVVHPEKVKSIMEWPKLEKIPYSITSLQKKETKFVWFAKCEDLYVETSSSQFLMQDSFIVSYQSRILKIHERNYATHDLELATIVHALQMPRVRDTICWENIVVEY